MVSQRELRAEITREKILDAAAEEIYRVGFQAASLADMLARLRISKGALYHHFGSKQELGYAVLEEVFCARLGSTWEAALGRDDPIDGIEALLDSIAAQMEGHTLLCGCPINNLAQEMSPVDEGFRQRIQKIYDGWHRRLKTSLQKAQVRGLIRQDVDADAAAYFIIASMQGATGLAKNARNCGIFRASMHALRGYLETLRQT